MIKLGEISGDLKKEFFDSVKDEYIELLKANSSNSKYDKITKFFSATATYVDENRVKSVLIGEIDQLEFAAGEIKKIKRGKGAGEPQYDFNILYGNFTAKLGHELTDRMGVKVCPYCNRAYIHTLKRKKVRPQYDHFFNKADYPYLAISLYNLIPSCGVCNLAKGAYDTFDASTKMRKFIYPYRDEYGYDIKFAIENCKDEVRTLLGVSEEFDIAIDVSNADANLKTRANNAIYKLNLTDLYNKHKDYVANILRLRYIYDDSFLDALKNKFSSIFSSKSDLKSTLYLNYLTKDKWGGRILSKLTYDIVQEYKH